MKLAAFQELFQSRIVRPDAEDAPLFGRFSPSPHGATLKAMFDVYRSDYPSRLARFIADDYPALARLIGAEEFGALAKSYISTNPPRHYNARFYSTGLPDFMGADPRWRNNERALSMALFERAMTDAFDAADAAPLSVAELSKFAPEDWPRLKFEVHPSLRLLELSAGTLAAYEGKKVDGKLADAREFAAVWRVDETPMYRVLAPDEYVALSEARAGHAFGEICRMTAFQLAGDADPARLAQFLANWFENGMIAGMSVSDRDGRGKPGPLTDNPCYFESSSKTPSSA